MRSILNLAVCLSLAGGLLAIPLTGRLLAAQPAAVDKETEPPAAVDNFKPSKDWTALAPNASIWLDKKNQAVIMRGKICLRQGQLEMFACLRGTKEHESIVAVPTRAYVAHAGLVAAGVDPGTPVQFQPTYKAATGPEIEVFVEWLDAKGKQQRARAQDWITNVKTKKPMSSPFVFAGSGFWVDENTNEKRYRAEDGDFICVSNFSSAMLDVPVESGDSNDALLFEANADKIPPVGTDVTLILSPKVKAKAEATKQPAKKTP
jgi:hypothetical protein